MSEKRITVWVQEFQDRDNLVLQWTDPDTGKRKSKSAGTNDPEKAETARADLEYELNNNLYREPSRMAWDKFVELVEAEKFPGLRQNTQEAYRNALNTFAKVVSPKRADCLNTRNLSKALSWLRAQPGRKSATTEPATLKLFVQSLKTICVWAKEQGLLAEMPAFPKVKMPKKLPEPVPAEVFERLRHQAEGNGEMQLFFDTLWTLGLRISEGHNLRKEKCDDCPYLDPAERGVVFPADFSKADRDDWVPCPADLLERLLANPGAGPWVFALTGRSGKRRTVDAVSMHINRLARAAGVRLSAHALRRGFCSRLAKKYPLPIVQRLARHDSPQTTARFYVGLNRADLRAVVDAECNSLRNTQGTESHQSAESVDVKPEGYQTYESGS